MQRKALIVSGAVGAEAAPADVLRRFGFAEPIQAPTLSDAFARLRAERFDLLIVPLLDVDAAGLSAIDREARKGRVPMFVIGTAPTADPELILRAMRSGVQEFVLFPPQGDELVAALDRLLRRQQVEAHRGQVFAVYGGKGGVGKTTVAVNLAYELARGRADTRVALADLVVAGGDVRVLLDLKPAYDMRDLVEKVDRLDADLVQSVMTHWSQGVWALPSPDNAELDEDLDGAATTTIVDQLRGDFAYTVLDCEHHLSERTLSAFDAADRILLVTELTVPALRSAQRTLALGRRLGYSDQKLCVVVNRFQSGEVLTLADAEQVLKHEIFWKLPNDYRTAASALAMGVPLSQRDQGSKLARSFAQLAAKLGGTPTHTPAGNGNGHDTPTRLRRLLGVKR